MEPARIEVTDNGAQLSGDLTFATVTRLFDDMSKRVRTSAMPATIDLAGVGQIDSSGLALLLEWQSVYRKNGGTLEIRNPPEALLKIARLCDAEEHISASANSNTSNTNT